MSTCKKRITKHVQAIIISLNWMLLLQSKYPGCYYARVAFMWPAFVFSIRLDFHYLITRVSTLYEGGGGGGVNRGMQIRS